MGGIYSVIEICSKIVLKGQNYWILFPSNTPLISPTKDTAKKSGPAHCLSPWLYLVISKEGEKTLLQTAYEINGPLKITSLESNESLQEKVSIQAYSVYGGFFYR